MEDIIAVLHSYEKGNDEGKVEAIKAMVHPSIKFTPRQLSIMIDSISKDIFKVMGLKAFFDIVKNFDVDRNKCIREISNIMVSDKEKQEAIKIIASKCDINPGPIREKVVDPIEQIQNNLHTAEEDFTLAMMSSLQYPPQYGSRVIGFTGGAPIYHSSRGTPKLYGETWGGVKAQDFSDPYSEVNLARRLDNLRSPLQQNNQTRGVGITDIDFQLSGIQDIKTVEGEQSCIVCMDNRRSTMLDCGHANTCASCIRQIFQNAGIIQCPVCNKTSTKIQKVIFS